MSRRHTGRASRGRSYRSRRRSTPPYGGPLPWLLSLPARLHVRWLLIAAVMVLAMGAYAQVLLTAAPMPPSRPPTPAAPANDTALEVPAR